MKGHILCE